MAKKRKKRPFPPIDPAGKKGIASSIVAIPYPNRYPALLLRKEWDSKLSCLPHSSRHHRITLSLWFRFSTCFLCRHLNLLHYRHGLLDFFPYGFEAFRQLTKGARVSVKNDNGILVVFTSLHLHSSSLKIILVRKLFSAFTGLTRETHFHHSNHTAPKMQATRNNPLSTPGKILLSKPRLGYSRGLYTKSWVWRWKWRSIRSSFGITNFSLSIGFYLPNSFYKFGGKSPGSDPSHISDLGPWVLKQNFANNEPNRFRC